MAEWSRAQARQPTPASPAARHFARVFGELHGEPPHRILTAVCLAQADARLRGGASVTETCFAVGFGFLSHFVTTFRRRYGVRPSDVRRHRRVAGTTPQRPTR